jgi:hypothetical protein
MSSRSPHSLMRKEVDLYVVQLISWDGIIHLFPVYRKSWESYKEGTHVRWVSFFNHFPQPFICQHWNSMVLQKWSYTDWSCPYREPYESSPHPTTLFLRCILVLPSYLWLGLSIRLFHCSSMTRIFCFISLSCILCVLSVSSSVVSLQIEMWCYKAGGVSLPSQCTQEQCIPIVSYIRTCFK